MQTFGFWCDICRCKYVRHKCDGGLPCGHSRKEAIYVRAKGYGRNGESLYMSRSGKTIVDVWIEYAPKRGACYIGAGFDMWAYTVTFRDGRSQRVGEFLRGQDPAVIRAFLERWDSRKEPPLWWEIMNIPDQVEREEILNEGTDGNRT